jgi:phospholipase A-2-activating protein
VILSRLIRYVTFFIRYKLAFYLLVFLSFFLSQWDSASSSWTKIGDVVDAVGSRQKQLYEGKEYDYVFDVDIKDGAPPLKLPYNVNGEFIGRAADNRLLLETENPYGAAQRFLERNELPTSYVDQVVQFIEQNTTGVNLGSGGSNEYVDPFTGKYFVLLTE